MPHPTKLDEAYREYREHVQRTTAGPSEGAPPESPGPAKVVAAVPTGWGQLSERTRNRIEKMVACGISKETANVLVPIIHAIGADNAEWSVFASPDEDPPELILYHEKSGTHIVCSILGGPNGRDEPRP